MQTMDSYMLIRSRYEEESRRNSFGHAYENVFSALKGCLCEMEILPGTTLKEKVLADMLGISRTPVHQALSQAAGMGLLDFQPKIGYTVPDVDWDDLRRIFPIRRALETCCAEQAAAVAEKLDLTKLHKILIQMKDLKDETLSPSNVQQFCALEEAFHTEVCMLTQNPYLISVYKSMEPHFTKLRLCYFLMIMRRPRRNSTADMYTEHLTIYFAIRTKKPELANVAMEKHFQQS